MKRITSLIFLFGADCAEIVLEFEKAKSPLLTPIILSFLI